MNITNHHDENCDESCEPKKKAKCCECCNCTCDACDCC